MSKIAISGASLGSATFTIESPATSTNRTLTLPDASGTMVVTGGAQTIEFAAGTVSAPSITTTGDTNTGIFFPAADTIAFSEGGTEAMRIDSSGNVGIGTTSPVGRLSVIGGNNTTQAVFSGSTGGTGRGLRIATFLNSSNNEGAILDAQSTLGFATLVFQTASVERARITSGGALLVGTTTVSFTSNIFEVKNNENVGAFVHTGANAGSFQTILCQRTASTGDFISFVNQAGSASIGTIDTINNTATRYNTSSDYRLKENIAPMTGALAKVAQLKPVTYTWKEDGSAGDGFLAHELQEVCPEAVSGTKDGMEMRQIQVSPAVYEDVVIPAVLDEDGNEVEPERTEKRLVSEAVMEDREFPKYQGVDTSFLVATLTAAIQELKAELDSAKEANAALEARITAIENGA